MNYNYIQKHEIETYDNLLPLQIPTYEGSFYQLTRTLKMEIVKEVEPLRLLTVSFMLEKEAIQHIRECFNFIDMIGNLGGVVEVFVIVFGVLIYPISQYKFMLKSL